MLAVNAHTEFFRALQRQLKIGTVLAARCYLEPKFGANRHRDSVSLLAHELIQNLLLLVVPLKLGGQERQMLACARAWLFSQSARRGSKLHTQVLQV